MKLLVGDVGGTNARLTLYATPTNDASVGDVSTHSVISQKNFKNADFPHFHDILRAFISQAGGHSTQVDSCCLAVAGPVTGNSIVFTNRDGWVIDGPSIEKEFGITNVKLINDFVANGFGLLSLKEEDFVVLQEGTPRPDAAHLPMALIGAGTGLGECFLTAGSDGQYTAYPTEGGHAEFAPRTPLEVELLSFLQKKLGTSDLESSTYPHVSVERVVSGPGLESIYEFLRDKYPDEVDRSLDQSYNDAKEKGQLIGANRQHYPLFDTTMRIMFACFGSEVGNLAMKYLPYGGLYIAGGIAPKNKDLVTSLNSDFMQRFRRKGRMSAITQSFPLYLVTAEDLGVKGAHIVATRLLANEF